MATFLSIRTSKQKGTRERDQTVPALVELENHGLCALELGLQALCRLAGLVRPRLLPLQRRAGALQPAQLPQALPLRAPQPRHRAPRRLQTPPPHAAPAWHAAPAQLCLHRVTDSSRRTRRQGEKGRRTGAPPAGSRAAHAAPRPRPAPRPAARAARGPGRLAARVPGARPGATRRPPLPRRRRAGGAAPPARPAAPARLRTARTHASVPSAS